MRRVGRVLFILPVNILGDRRSWVGASGAFGWRLQVPQLSDNDIPFLFNTVWTADSRLKDLVDQFQEHLEELQDFWSTLDDIDNSLSIVNMKQPSRSISCRQIELGDDCFIMLSVDAKDPRSLPECRFVGSGLAVNSMRQSWRRNCGLWSKDKRFSENLELILKIQLPSPANVQKNDQQVECGICYAEFLPIDDELGSNSGTGTDYRCDNSNCKRTFHSVCLEDWLRSITTTRQSFDVLFGNCPYCSELVAVKINSERS